MKPNVDINGMIQDGWGRQHKLKALDRSKRHEPPIRDAARWADGSEHFLDTYATIPFAVAVTELSPELKALAHEAEKHFVTAVKKHKAERTYRGRRKPGNVDVRIAKCTKCRRHFGYVPTYEEFKALKPDDIVERECDRHGTT